MSVTFTPDTSCPLNINGEQTDVTAGVEITLTDSQYAVYTNAGYGGVVKGEKVKEEKPKAEPDPHPTSKGPTVVGDSGTPTPTKK